MLAALRDILYHRLFSVTTLDYVRLGRNILKSLPKNTKLFVVLIRFLTIGKVRIVVHPVELLALYLHQFFSI